ncbi:MAG: c-type cytochrome biogenesis protein CcmI [Betaproteobacteria bacterium]
MFWVIACVLVVVAVATLVFPLLRVARTAAPMGRPAEALEVLRDQRREIDDEVAAGRIGADERETRIAELVRRVHDEGLGSAQSGAASLALAPPQRRLGLAIVLGLLIPALALPLYLIVGTPAALDPSARVPAAGKREFTPEQLRGALATLKTRLETTPDDVTGWTMLGRGLLLLNDFPGSAAAFERAVAIKADDAGLLADFADALAMQRGGDFTGKPSELIQAALKVNPQLPKALALAAAAAFAQNQFEAARGYWQRLLVLLPPDSPPAQEVKAMIEQVAARAAGVDKPASPQQATASPAPVAPAPTPASAPATAAATGGAATAAAIGKAITGTVRLAPALAGKMAAGDTLFIFARAVDGPRMPLAIVRGSASELPRAFRLDDSVGMAGGPLLSAAAQVRIEARVSRSGEALPRTGDLRGESAVVAAGTAGVEVVIDRLVP